MSTKKSLGAYCANTLKRSRIISVGMSVSARALTQLPDLLKNYTAMPMAPEPVLVPVRKIRRQFSSAGGITLWR